MFTHVSDVYQRSAIETGDSANIILALYERALKFMREAKEEKVEFKFVSALDKALTIVRALMSALDFERGGDIALNLYRLYDFIIWKLDEAISNKDTTPVDEAYKIMDDLYKAWCEAIMKMRGVTGSHEESKKVLLRG